MQELGKETFLSKLFSLLTKKQKKKMILLVLLFIISSIFQVVGVAAIFPFINLVIDPAAIKTNYLLEQTYKFFNFQSETVFIVFIGVTMFILIVAGNLISAFTIWVKTKYVMNLNHSLAKNLLHVYLSRPYTFFLNQNTSEMGKNILTEVNHLTTKMLIPLFDFIINVLIVLSMFLFLLFTDIMTTIIAFAVLGGSYLIINRLVRKRLRVAGNERLRANKGRYSTTGEALSGIKTTKVFGREEFFLSSFNRFSKQYTKIEAYVKVAGELPKYILETIAFGGIILLVVFLTISSENTMQSIPIITLFAFAGYRMMPALQKVYHAVANIQFSQAILDTLYDELKDYSPNNKLKKDENVLPFMEKIEISEVSFSYNRSDVKTLANINLSIEKNTSVGFVGSTGSGKTTLIDLILGLLSPDSGQIVVDDQNLDFSNVRAWQNGIGYVPQEIFLSDDTIAHNIGFGLHKDVLDYERVKTAAKIAALDDFITKELPEQYETVVGERGIRLSGGQRQRIGLARALYNNPQILVLDEATSSLDGTTEKAVMQAIKQASLDRTMIMIAHRLSTVKDCDVIYLLERGTIRDKGTYDELVARNSDFKRMARHS